MKSDSKKSVCGRVLLIAILMSFSLLAIGVYAIPDGPTFFGVNETGRKPIEAAAEIPAFAGNVSHLSVFSKTVTRTWQGYYGNITGEIVLADSSNYTLYNWLLDYPSGEIYASNSTVDFSLANIGCYNFSRTGSDYLELSELEASLGLSNSDADGVNETFTMGTDYSPFYAGENLISGECPTTHLLNSSGEKDPNMFSEVMLYDNRSMSVVYTAIIEEDFPLGFDLRPWNFQMIVGENGHEGDTATTPYYFYVEVE